MIDTVYDLETLCNIHKVNVHVNYVNDTFFVKAFKHKFECTGRGEDLHAAINDMARKLELTKS